MIGFFVLYRRIISSFENDGWIELKDSQLQQIVDKVDSVSFEYIFYFERFLCRQSSMTDKDGDGKISFEEFCAVSIRMSKSFRGSS